jgi:hypothetical protein
VKPRRTGSPAYAGDDSECAALAGPFPNMTTPSRGWFARALLDCPSPLNEREQGMPGARCTRGLMCKIVRRDAHEHTGSAETLRHSPRNGFTAYAAISPATNSSCHRHRRIKGLAAPGWADETSADLTPATGARTTRFCRTLWRRRLAQAMSLTGSPALRYRLTPTLPRPPHPVPTFVTMANAPLLEDETAKLIVLICPTL